MPMELKEIRPSLTGSTDNMLHFDYTWDLSSEGIILDEELNIDRIGWQGGDLFRLENRNGRAMLVKVNKLEEFILKGAMDEIEI
jgi:hypothetical protein